MDLIIDTQVLSYRFKGIEKDIHSKSLGLSRIYAEAGIQEYWVSDLNNSQFKVFRDWLEGCYQTEITLVDGIIYPLSFPDVAIDVRRLFSYD